MYCRCILCALYPIFQVPCKRTLLFKVVLALFHHSEHQTGPQYHQQCTSSTGLCFDWLDEVYWDHPVLFLYSNFYVLKYNLHSLLFENYYM